VPSFPGNLVLVTANKLETASQLETAVLPRMRLQLLRASVPRVVKEASVAEMTPEVEMQAEINALVETRWKRTANVSGLSRRASESPLPKRKTPADASREIEIHAADANPNGARGMEIGVRRKIHAAAARLRAPAENELAMAVREPPKAEASGANPHGEMEEEMEEEMGEAKGLGLPSAQRPATTTAMILLISETSTTIRRSGTRTLPLGSKRLVRLSMET
jgi:hypothetical protein